MYDTVKRTMNEIGPLGLPRRPQGFSPLEVFAMSYPSSVVMLGDDSNCLGSLWEAWGARAGCGSGWGNNMDNFLDFQSHCFNQGWVCCAGWISGGGLGWFVNRLQTVAETSWLYFDPCPLKGLIRTELLPSLPHEQSCYLAVPTNRIAT